jgi:hypothetical protein
VAAPYSDPAGYAPPRMPPPRPRRRWPWVVLVVVLIVVGLLVAADRIALNLAEDKAASTLQSSQHLTNEPDVSVDGFPFLTQLLDGRFPSVTVSDDDVQVTSGLAIDHITVHLHDVTVHDSYHQVDAATADADALIGYNSLSRALKMRISSRGNGVLVAHPNVDFGGRHYTAPVTAGVRTRGDQIRFTHVTVAGRPVPPRAARLLDRTFATSLSLAGLPFHIRLTGADVTSSGLVLHLDGRDLSYHA